MNANKNLFKYSLLSENPDCKSYHNKFQGSDSFLFNHRIMISHMVNRNKTLLQTIADFFIISFFINYPHLLIEGFHQKPSSQFFIS